MAASMLDALLARPRFRLGSHFAKPGRRVMSQYCVDLVRKHDYENYLCSLLLPSNVRRTAFAVGALNVELAQIRDVVSNPTIGLMRIQFWKDALNKIYQGHSLQQPLVLELSQVIHDYKLSKHWLHRLIESREKSLYDMQYQLMSDVENYAENTISSVFYLLLQAKGVESVSCDHAASHLGKCKGIVNLIRSIPYHASKNRVELPTDELTQHGVSREEILRGRGGPNLANLVYHVASAAHAHLRKARQLSPQVSREARPLFLPAVACTHYLERLRRRDFDVFHLESAASHPRLPWLLWWNRLLRRY